jgi:2-polyprenyl-3-methyl-5-hydroxy-6-metoxy-1,4-benzoquinol methylase
MKVDKYLEQCFKGEIIYGDNFTTDEIKNWFEKEKEGYSRLGTNELEDLNNNIYHYHQLNKEYGFKYLNDLNDFQNVLGVGSATGIEFEPIVGKIKKLYILEPSEELRANKLKALEINYEAPSINGKINFEGNKFDLITSFGVLHHIPNVSFVMSEISRVLKTGGILLLREPIVSMGDWREERHGLTKNERGIPIKAFKQIILQNNLEILA